MGRSLDCPSVEDAVGDEAKMRLWHWLHGRNVHVRRVRVLRDRIAALIPSNASVLDVGCGDGLLSGLLAEARPDITVKGIEVLVRPDAHVPVEEFDGTHIPHLDKAFDVALFVDVIHHVTDPLPLLAEATRVSRVGLIIKDHVSDGFLAPTQLRMMDNLANTRHGITPPCHYLSRAEWAAAFLDLGLAEDVWQTKLGLYPWPADLVFGRSLHFLARLRRQTML